MVLQQGGKNSGRIYDAFVIGGGVNGCGIARDLAGRGFAVGLAEMNDLASATSSASTKLFHGGLRYLEYFEFRLVREALREREILLAAMPHISWPMRFVLPYHRDMRFETETPLGRAMALALPWLRGRRPAWLIRLGLFLYDHIGGRRDLPATRGVDLADDETGAPLKDEFRRGYEYSDCWVEDSRLVVLNARDAADRGTTIMPRTKVVAARREEGLWRIETRGGDGTSAVHRARCLVNASGPWVGDVIGNAIGLNLKRNLRLVRGSHIITRRLFDHGKCYFFQGVDGRIVFAIPYEGEFTLIGTTDIDHPSPDTEPVCTDAERDYLCSFVSRYFRRPVTAKDIVATYSGVRPLDDGEGGGTATSASRDYQLQIETDGAGGAALLNIFGGKITTYRRLAESACAALAPYLGHMPADWTAGVPLPGGDFPVDGFDMLVELIEHDHPYLPDGLARRLARAYGTDTATILEGCSALKDLGRDFGSGVFGREIDWVADKEWVTSADDFVWRRTRLGLRLSARQIAEIDSYSKARG